MSQSKTTIVKVWQKIIQVHIFAIHELKKVAWLHHKRHTPKSDAIGQFFLKNKIMIRVQGYVQDYDVVRLNGDLSM